MVPCWLVHLAGQQLKEKEMAEFALLLQVALLKILNVPQWEKYLQVES